MPPAIAEALHALAAWPGAAALRSSTALYATVNAAHILAIGLIIGSIATLDLRILGVFRSVPLAALARPLSTVAGGGVVLAILTGLLLFSVRPAAYAQNPAFLIKVGLVALGVLNALPLRRNRSWRSASIGDTPPLSVRLAALGSLLIWTAAVLSGRWIGFLQ